MRPFFTVLIPAYNVFQHIEATIQSVLSQTYNDFEILVIDDGSTDGTFKLLERINDPRLRLLRQENRGVSYTRNRGIKEAKGRYIAFLDGDDQWCSRHLEIAAECLKSQPNIKWYAAPFKYVPEITEEMLAVEVHSWKTEVISYFGNGCNYAWSSSTVIDREALIGLMSHGIFFPEDMTHGEDLAAWVRFAISFPMLATSHQLTAYCILRNDSALSGMNGMHINLTMTNSLARYFSNYILSFPCSLEARLFMRNQLLVRWIIQLRESKLIKWRDVLLETKPDTHWIVRNWVRGYILFVSGLANAGIFYIKIVLKINNMLLQRELKVI
jgi:glycosyltransferase involved in cell wall biosynthesis